MIKNIHFIQSVSHIPICIDTEGSQIRTGRMAGNEVFLNEGSFVTIHQKQVTGNAQNITFYPTEAIDRIHLLDCISIDFDSVLVQVVEKKNHYLKTKVITEGLIGSNKAVTVNRPILLDSLTKKDRKAIKIALDLGIKHFALSFANHVEDVLELRSLTGKECFLISKIETHAGVSHIESISKESDAILIDRGDLSREEPIEDIPLLQKFIIHKTKKTNAKIYVATNLLETMVTQKKPTRAEVSDVLNTLIDGADGLVLAAETAIGENPVGCVNMISKLMNQYYNYCKFDMQIDKYEKRSLLIEPHAGHLVNQFLDNPDIPEIKKLPCLEVSEEIVMECEQIASGVYSPLKGFMNKEEIESVLNHYCLPDNTVWPLPIFFQVRKECTGKLRKGDLVALKNTTSKELFAIMTIESIFSLELNSFAKRLFGSDSEKHPGVSRLKGAGGMFLAGKIELFKYSNKSARTAPYILSPADTRMIMEQKNWYRTVGFHTKTVIHRGDEFIQLKTLNDYYCDGLLVLPCLGSQKKNDFHNEIVFDSYQTMIDFNLYPKNKVLIGASLSYSRYAGPRENVFIAICQKNYGCSHLLMGRDHLNDLDYYSYEETVNLFEKLGDIGISPILFKDVFYCEQCKGPILSCEHQKSGNYLLNGSILRKNITEEKKSPHWLLREEISEMLVEAAKRRKQIFIR